MVSTAIRMPRQVGAQPDHRARCRLLSIWVARCVAGVAAVLLILRAGGMVPAFGPLSAPSLAGLLAGASSLLLFHAGRAPVLGQVLAVGVAALALRGPLAPAAIFASMGLALVGLHRGWKSQVVESAAGVAAGLSMLAEIGFAYQAAELSLAIRGVAVSTALLLGLLAFALLLARPHTGLVALYTRPGVAGVAARSLILPVLFVPFLLGWVELAGARAGQFDLPMAEAMTAVGTMAVFGAIVTVLATTLSRLEEQLAEVQRELVQANRVDVASYMAGWIAHEFNNLMTSIQGNVQLAVQEPDLPGPAREYLVDASDSCAEAVALSHKLLRFSGHEVVTTEPLDLVPMLTEARPRLAEVMGPRVRTELEVLCPSARIRANSVRVDYILMQLVLNARDAMPAGGVLQLVVSSDATSARLVVRDSGHGMSPEVRARAFEPFMTTKPRTRGTGLGLPTVYGIVKQLKGTIEIESQEGSGTTVSIELPLAGPIGS